MPFSPKMIRIWLMVGGGLILLFFLFSSVPGLLTWKDWFGKKSYSLKATALNVGEITSIGELVTAEYYGDVVSSFSEVFVSMNDSSTAATYAKIRRSWETTVNIGEDENWSQEKRMRKRQKAFKKDLSPAESILYHRLLGAEDLFSVGPYRKEKRFLVEVIESVSTDSLLKLPGYANWRNGYIEEDNSRRELNKDIVYIGRGWVRAGFDLSRLPDPLPLPDTNGTLFLTDFEPVIFDTVINPWFMPAERIPGFEIVRSEKDRRISFENVLLVKAKCKAKLAEHAEDSGILAEAIANGERTLASLFAMAPIVGKDGRLDSVKQVRIVPGPAFPSK